MTDLALEVTGLVKEFHVSNGRHGRRSVLAVDHVSFSVARGEVLGLVGESGSGKSTTARCILRLIEPTEGTVRFEGQDVTNAGRRELRAMRRGMQMVFQDPFASLDPRMTLQQIIGEGLQAQHLLTGRKKLRSRCAELMEMVGLLPTTLDQRPDSLSGGQRQRVGIARALALEPTLLVCDEPVASLDVSIQAQILNLFKRLQNELGLTIIFVAHDLSTVRYLCNRVAVMADGKIEEIGTRAEIYNHPRTRYTQALLASAPLPDPIKQRESRRVRAEHAYSETQRTRYNIRPDHQAPN